MAKRKSAARKRKPASSHVSRFLTSAIRPAPNVDRRYGLDSKQWAEEGRWVWVKSSNVAAIHYEKDTRILQVAFTHGVTYSYVQVPQQVAENMFNASSMGTYVHMRLKDNYAFSKSKTTTNIRILARFIGGLLRTGMMKVIGLFTGSAISKAPIMSPISAITRTRHT